MGVSISLSLSPYTVYCSLNTYLTKSLIRTKKKKSIEFVLWVWIKIGKIFSLLVLFKHLLFQKIYNRNHFSQVNAFNFYGIFSCIIYSDIWEAFLPNIFEINEPCFLVKTLTQHYNKFCILDIWLISNIVDFYVFIYFKLWNYTWEF